MGWWYCHKSSLKCFIIALHCITCMSDITGVPDAYENNLESHEVFVYVPLLRGGSINSCRPYIECDVLVTRHPMHHPGDIRKLRAVRNEKLLELCRGSTNP